MLSKRLTSELHYVLAIFSDFYEDAVSKSLRLPHEKHFQPTLNPKKRPETLVL